MEYIEKETIEAQEHFIETLMFAQNNSDKDIHFMEKAIFEKMLVLGNRIIRVH